MFAKVFRQIFESSIAEKHEVRHTFMDLLVLSDSEGVVDMTHEAIARITNVPIEIIRATITELETPDPQSRNEKAEGRRLQRLDGHRNWGWEIVNYESYRQMRDEEARRAYFRERKREQRAKAKKGVFVPERPSLSNAVKDSPQMSPMQKEKEKEKESYKEDPYFS